MSHLPMEAEGARKALRNGRVLLFAYSPSIILPSMKELMPLAEYVAANQELYGADVDIYGSFPELLEEIKQSYEQALKTNAP